MVAFCKILIISVFLLVDLFAASPLDSIPKKVKPRFLVGFDARNSFVADQKARIGGLRLGMELKNKYRFGLGIYATSPPVTKNVTVHVPGKPDPVHVTAVIRLSYLAPFFEYVWYQSKRWEFSTPVVFGLGAISVQISRSNAPKDSVQQIDGLTLLGEAAITGHYKIFSWIGIGSGVGYRKLFSGPLVSKNFDSFIYILKVKIFPKPIIQAIFCRKKDVVTEK